MDEKKKQEIVSGISKVYGGETFIVLYELSKYTHDYSLSKQQFKLKYIFIGNTSIDIYRKLISVYDDSSTSEDLIKLFKEKNEKIFLKEPCIDNRVFSDEEIKTIVYQNSNDYFDTIVYMLKKENFPIDSLTYNVQKETYSFYDSNHVQSTYSNNYSNISGLGMNSKTNSIFEIYFDNLETISPEEIVLEIKNKFESYNSCVLNGHFRKKVKLSIQSIYQLVSFILPFLQEDKIEDAGYFYTTYVNNKSILHEGISISELRNLDDYFIVKFDAEGIPQNEKSIIIDGKIKSLIGIKNTDTKNKGNLYFSSNTMDILPYQITTQNLLLEASTENTENNFDQVIDEFVIGTYIHPKTGRLFGSAYVSNAYSKKKELVNIDMEIKHLFDKILYKSEKRRYKNMLSPEIIIEIN